MQKMITNDSHLFLLRDCRVTVVNDKVRRCTEPRMTKFVLCASID